MTGGAPDAVFVERLKKAGREVERVLEALLTDKAAPGEILRPARLLGAMRHAVLGAGKRLRPFLLIETAALFGASGEGVIRAGAAVELLHCYSLVHDDLPCMDDDDLRRGRPTVHRAFDEATAVLAGDALLTLAFDVLADPLTHADAGVRAELVLGLARASGLGGMVGGQALDLAAESARTPLAEDETERLQAMKTGALLRFAVLGGAVIGRAPALARAALDDYGCALGAAFQIADDILDAEGSEAQLGKRAGKDAERNKATLVAALGLGEAKNRRDRLAAAAQAALAQGGFGGAADVLGAAARFVVQREN